MKYVKQRMSMRSGNVLYSQIRALARPLDCESDRAQNIQFGTARVKLV